MGGSRKWLAACALSLSLIACGNQPTTGNANTTATPAASAGSDIGGALSAQALTSQPTLLRVTSGGNASLLSGAPAGGELQNPELAPSIGVADGPNAAAFSLSQSRGQIGFNRRLPGTREGRGERDDHPRTAAIPRIIQSFNGLNHRSTRTANGGNQFSNEPPDQGLCVGAGSVLETVNSVLRVYSASGNPRTPAIDLNTFNGYPAAITRNTTPPQYGPDTFDPSCHYDAAVKRWFHLTDVLGRNPSTGNLTGKNSLDLAVSTTSDPAGSWIVYHLPAHNDGTDGTPNHGNCPCFGDYPHLGADANGVYITTNEFSLVTGAYNGVNIYAIPKAQLARGVASLDIPSFYLADGSTAVPAFTLMPALSPGDEFAEGTGGTEYFVSSLAVFADNGTSKQLAVWGLTNTASLNSRSPNLTLNVGTVNVAQYAVPPAATQKPGDFPLGQCINDTTLPTPFGTGCWNYLFASEPAHTETLSPLDASDSRVFQVMYADGKLWTTLGSAVDDNGTQRAGAAWYILKPQSNKNKMAAQVVNQGIISVPGNNVIYPAVAVTEEGSGAIGVTLTGTDYHPSAAFFGINKYGVSNLGIAALGLSTQDGFSGYVAYSAPDPVRPRWGDYAAAATDGNSIWLANEYIAANCTLAQFMTSPFGSCGGTRTALANWATRITQVQAP